MSPLKKRILGWFMVVIAASGLYFVFENSWKKALGLLVAALIIDVAVDFIIIDVQQEKGDD